MSSAIRLRAAEFRTAPELGEGFVRAYVTTFDTTYDIGFGWSERIERGAFAESIAAQGSVPLMWAHDWQAGPIGVSRAFTEDGHGLQLVGELFLDDPRARTIWRAMDAGALREWSIGFYAESIRNDAAEPDTDIIERGRLAEVSVVVRGANPDTSTVEVRSGGREPGPVKVPVVMLDRIGEPHVRSILAELI